MLTLFTVPRNKIKYEKYNQLTFQIPHSFFKNKNKKLQLKHIAHQPQTSHSCLNFALTSSVSPMNTKISKSWFGS
jgi:hypothetical protein